MQNQTSTNLEELPSKKEVAAITTVMVVIIVGAYEIIGAYNHHLESTGYSFLSLHSFLDDLIPFVPIFGYPYYMYYSVILIAAAIGSISRRALQEVAFGYLAMTLISWVSWLTFPVRMVRPEMADCVQAGCGLVKAMYEIDPGYNVMPSLHVAHSVFTWFFVRRYRPRWLGFVTPIALGVCASTVLIKQHYVIDIPPGLALGFVGYLVGMKYSAWVFDQAEQGWLALVGRQQQR